MLSEIPSPSKAIAYKRKLEVEKNKTTKYRKKIRSLRATNKRQKKKIENMASILEQLKKSNFCSEDVLDTLTKVSEVNKEFIVRQLSKVTDEKCPRKFSAELKAFALTLHFYSPRAYDYVRETFESCLPHPRTISRWYSHIDGKPGFTSESLKYLKMIAEKSSYTLICGLMIDEMSIRKHVDWDGTNFHGFINLGYETNDDSMPLAKDALVFMVVAMNQSWKLPVGYFLIDSLTSEQRANLVIQALELIQNTGIKVVSLTCDGLASNLTMFRLLGCNFQAENLKTNFAFNDSPDNVQAILDPCHMLKLVRNTLGDFKIIYDDKNNKVQWKYLEKLNELQEKEGLHLANKLTNLHIHYKKQIMKVRLATQLFSSSVADALEFCEELKIEDFKDSGATAKFIRYFNNLFDVLNSRSLKQPGFKQALNPKNKEETIKFLDLMCNYIANLKTVNGEKLIQSRRKTGFLGLLVCIQSIKNLFTDLIEEKETNGAFLKCLPLYKVSQDHLELFFSSVRSCGGFNNNPSARQFQSAYKKLIVNSQIKSSNKGNCCPLEELFIMSSSTSVAPEKIINTSCGKSRLIDETLQEQCAELKDHNYAFDPSRLSEYSTHVVEYIAGWVVRKLNMELKCEDCLAAILSPAGEDCSFIKRKNRGGLIYPSNEVKKICKKSESFFRMAIKSNYIKYKEDQIVSKVLESFLNENIFPELDLHMHDVSPLENHSIHLVRAVAKKYLHLRYHYFAKTIVQNTDSMRQLYTKFIKFSGF